MSSKDSKIYFFKKDTNHNIGNTKRLELWIKKIIIQHHQILSGLNIIFCSDNYLLSMNQNYLGHDTFTDVITFTAHENVHLVGGDIFISIDRVWANSSIFRRPFHEELHRTIIHGVLHLIGFKDKHPLQKTRMHQLENTALLELKTMFKRSLLRF